MAIVKILILLLFHIIIIYFYNIFIILVQYTTLSSLPTWLSLATTAPNNPWEPKTCKNLKIATLEMEIFYNWFILTFSLFTTSWLVQILKFNQKNYLRSSPNPYIVYNLQNFVLFKIKWQYWKYYVFYSLVCKHITHISIFFPQNFYLSDPSCPSTPFYFFFCGVLTQKEKTNKESNTLLHFGGVRICPEKSLCS